MKWRVNLSSGELTEVGSPVTVIKSKKCDDRNGAQIDLKVIDGKPYGVINDYDKAPKLLRVGSSSVSATSSSKPLTDCYSVIVSASSFTGLCYGQPGPQYALYYVRGGKAERAATPPKGFQWEGNVASESDSRFLYIFGSYKGVFKLYKISKSGI